MYGRSVSVGLFPGHRDMDSESEASDVSATHGSIKSSCIGVPFPPSPEALITAETIAAYLTELERVPLILILTGYRAGALQHWRLFTQHNFKYKEEARNQNAQAQTHMVPNDASSLAAAAQVFHALSSHISCWQCFVGTQNWRGGERPGLVHSSSLPRDT